MRKAMAKSSNNINIIAEDLMKRDKKNLDITKVKAMFDEDATDYIDNPLIAL